MKTESRKPFELRPGEPRNPRAWLGVAAYIRMRAYPLRYFSLRGSAQTGLVGKWDYLPQSLDETRDGQLRNWLITAPADWRRVLLPMLLEEAKKRGLDD
jgi:hypothetical protein